MQPRRPGMNRDSRQRRDWLAFVLQTGGPAIVVNFLMLTRANAALSLFGIPFCDLALDQVRPLGTRRASRPIPGLCKPRRSGGEKVCR